MHYVFYVPFIFGHHQMSRFNENIHSDIYNFVSTLSNVFGQILKKK